MERERQGITTSSEPVSPPLKENLCSLTPGVSPGGLSGDDSDEHRHQTSQAGPQRETDSSPAAGFGDIFRRIVGGPSEPKSRAYELVWFKL